MVEHVNIPDSELHEPKGVAGASQYTVYVADGSGSGSWTTPEPKGVRGELANKVYVTNGASSGTMTDISQVSRSGIWDYEDLATASSAISITPTGTDVVLTNDGAGAGTIDTYKITGIGDLWDTSTNRFDFTDLTYGDSVDIRLDFELTTTASNTDTVVKLNLGIGGTPYSLVIDRSSFKAAGTYPMSVYTTVQITDANTQSNPASVTISSDSGSATVEVGSWNIRAIKRGL